MDYNLGYSLSLVSRLHPFLKSDSGEGVWSTEQTFLSQLWNFVAGVGMKIRLHVNCEYQMASRNALFCLLLLLFRLFKKHILFLEDLNNSHKFWG